MDLIFTVLSPTYLSSLVALIFLMIVVVRLILMVCKRKPIALYPVYLGVMLLCRIRWYHLTLRSTVTPLGLTPKYTLNCYIGVGFTHHLCFDTKICGICPEIATYQSRYPQCWSSSQIESIWWLCRRCTPALRGGCNSGSIRASRHWPAFSR